VRVRDRLDRGRDDDGVRARRVRDLREALERLVPRAAGRGDYAHNVLNADDNAHAHLRASIVGRPRPCPGGRPAGARAPGSSSS
jgi:hypothetical protein